MLRYLRLILLLYLYMNLLVLRSPPAILPEPSRLNSKYCTGRFPWSWVEGGDTPCTLHKTLAHPDLRSLCGQLESRPPELYTVLAMPPPVPIRYRTLQRPSRRYSSSNRFVLRGPGCAQVVRVLLNLWCSRNSASVMIYTRRRLIRGAQSPG